MNVSVSKTGVFLQRVMRSTEMLYVICTACVWCCVVVYWEIGIAGGSTSEYRVEPIDIPLECSVLCTFEVCMGTDYARCQLIPCLPCQRRVTSNLATSVAHVHF